MRPVDGGNSAPLSSTLASIGQQGAAAIAAARKSNSGGGLSGFIKAARGTVAGAASGVESMARSIGASFGSGMDVAERVPKATRVFGSDLVRNIRTEAATPGTPGHAFMNRPMLSSIIPGLDTGVGRKISGFILPSPKHITSDASELAAHPSIGAGGAVANDIFQVVTAPLLAQSAGHGVGALASRGGGLASEAGAVKPGFMRSAEEVFAAGRKAAQASQLADVAGETQTAARTAVKAAKQLVEPETGLVMTRAERAGSGLVGKVTPHAAAETATAAESATNAGMRAAEGAAEAAKAVAKEAVSEAPTTAGRGRSFIETAKRISNIPRSGIEAAGRNVLGAGKDIVQTVAHPDLWKTGKVTAEGKPVLASMPRAAARYVGGYASLPFKLGGKAVQAGGELMPAAAVAAGGAAAVAAERRASMNDAADSEMAKNMGMSTEDFRGIRAVQQKYGESGMQALVSGLAKAKKSGYLAAGGTRTKQAKTILRMSVAGSYLKSLK